MGRRVSEESRVEVRSRSEDEYMKSENDCGRSNKTYRYWPTLGKRFYQNIFSMHPTISIREAKAYEDAEYEDLVCQLTPSVNTSCVN